MMVKNFKNIKKLPLELSRLFSQNETIQRLLVIDSNDALSTTFTPLTFKELMDEKYISIIPLNETGIENMGRNTFMVINVCTSTILDKKDSNNVFGGSIFICSDLDHLLLENYDLRLLTLMETIVDAIDEQKFSCSGQLEVTSSRAISYSNYLFGYHIEFTISDQPSKGADL